MEKLHEAAKLRDNAFLPLIEEHHIETLCQNLSNHVEHAKRSVLRSINIEMVKAYWLIGRDIIQY